MAAVHTLKKTRNEVVLKIYRTDNGGGTEQIELDSDKIKLDNETFVGADAEVTITEIYWGTKPNKHVDISRVNDPVANTIHGHYYLQGAGHYDYNGFADDVYSNGAVRVTGDGPFHVILKLTKTSGYNV